MFRIGDNMSMSMSMSMSMNMNMSMNISWDLVGMSVPASHV